MSQTKMEVPTMTDITDIAAGRVMREISRAVVAGEPRGPFLIHRTLHCEERYTLSHVQSGGAVDRMLCCKNAAMALADDLIALGLNWNFDGKPHPSGLVKGIPRATKTAARAVVMNARCPVHNGGKS